MASNSPLMLNLDDLTGDRKVVTLNGVDHEAVEMTLESYLGKLKRAKELEALPDTMETKVQASIEFLNETYPSIGLETLRKLPLRKMNALIIFTMQAPEDIAKGVEQAQAPAPEGNV